MTGINNNHQHGPSCNHGHNHAPKKDNKPSHSEEKMLQELTNLLGGILPEASAANQAAQGPVQEEEQSPKVASQEAIKQESKPVSQEAIDNLHKAKVKEAKNQKSEKGFWDKVKETVFGLPFIGGIIKNITKYLGGPGEHTMVLGANGLPIATIPAENLRTLSAKDIDQGIVMPGAQVLVPTIGSQSEPVVDDESNLCLRLAELAITKAQDKAQIEKYTGKQFREPVGIKEINKGSIEFVEREDIKVSAPLALSAEGKTINTGGEALRYLSDAEKNKTGLVVVKANPDGSYAIAETVAVGGHKIKNFDDSYTEIKELTGSDEQQEFVKKDELRILRNNHPAIDAELRKVLQAQ